MSRQVSARGSGRGENVEALLTEKGASISCQDAERGWSPLMHAAYNGHLEAIAVLMSHGADIDHRGGRRGSTALQSAACAGRIAAVQQLILAGADVMRPNFDGKVNYLDASPILLLSRLLRANCNPDTLAQGCNCSRQHRGGPFSFDMAPVLGRWRATLPGR